MLLARAENTANGPALSLSRCAPNRSAMTHDPSFIQNPPGDIAGWLAAFEARDIPVFESTVLSIADAAEVEDSTDAHSLAEVLTDDPLMTLKLLRYVAELRRGRLNSDVETVTASLVMIGIPPFFSGIRRSSQRPDAPRTFTCGIAGTDGRTTPRLSCRQILIGLRSAPHGPRRRGAARSGAVARLCRNAALGTRTGLGAGHGPTPAPQTPNALPTFLPKVATNLRHRHVL